MDRRGKDSPLIENIPAEMKDRPQWVSFDGRKHPKNPITGRNAKVNDPNTWGSFEQALELCRTRGLRGLGFVFDYRDPYCGIDLDKCIDPESGEIEPWAKDIVDRLNSYTEISPSGRGVHILLRAEVPKGRRIGQFEVYDKARYFTMTGNHLKGAPLDMGDRQTELADLLKELEPGRVHRGKNGEIEVVPFKNSIPSGQRRNFLAALGISLRKWGLGEEDIFSLLWPAYQTLCDHEPEPVSKKEVARIAKSTAQYPVDWRSVNMKAGPTEARRALKDMGGVATYTALFKRIQVTTGCAVAAAKRAIANAVKWELLTKPDKKFGYGHPYTLREDSDNARMMNIVDKVIERGERG